MMHTFDRTTDRREWARAMIQDLEDRTHGRRLTQGLLDDACALLTDWLFPVALYHGIRYIRVDGDIGSEAGGSAWFGVEFSSPDDMDLFREREPIIAAAIQTPVGMCACHGVIGVQHDH